MKSDPNKWSIHCIWSLIVDIVLHNCCMGRVAPTYNSGAHDPENPINFHLEQILGLGLGWIIARER